MIARRIAASRATIARMRPIRAHLPALLLPLLLLTSCATQVPPPVLPSIVDAPVANAAWYAQAAKAGQTIYTIDSAQSLITVVVRRGGPLARFGHDHVVASRGIAGLAAPDAGRADFQFRLDQMTVDEAALRTEAGLDTQPTADAIDGTRTNMLTRVLEAERFPLVQLRADRGAPGSDVLQLTVTLHGVTRTQPVPVKLERTPTALTASGQFKLLQSEFGITPMSVMGGAMRVEDQMELRFKIVATPAR